MAQTKEQTIELTIKSINFLINDDITTQKRNREFSEYRQIGYNFLRKLNFTTQKIGDSFKRHHTTVLHGLKEFDYNYKHIPSFRDKSSKFLFTYKIMLETNLKKNNVSKKLSLQQRLYYYESLMKSNDFIFALDVLKKCINDKSIKEQIEKIIYKNE